MDNSIDIHQVIEDALALLANSAVPTASTSSGEYVRIILYPLTNNLLIVRVYSPPHYDDVEEYAKTTISVGLGVYKSLHNLPKSEVGVAVLNLVPTSLLEHYALNLSEISFSHYDQWSPPTGGKYYNVYEVNVPIVA